jgi:hypothetical protein
MFNPMSNVIQINLIVFDAKYMDQKAQLFTVPFYIHLPKSAYAGEI